MAHVVNGTIAANCMVDGNCPASIGWFEVVANKRLAILEM
jgi:hypothetical protein